MLNRISKLFQFFDATRVLHCVKIAVALGLGIAVMRVLPMPKSQWILMTIVVVMTAQVHVGSMLKKSIMRAGGTLVGAATAVLVLTFFHHNQVVYAAVVIFGGLFFTYWGSRPGDSGSIGMLGMITLIMILYSQLPSLTVATYRTIEVLLGIFIASIVSTLFFPIRAKIKLKQSFYHNLNYFSDLFVKTLIQHKSRLDDPATAEIDQQIYWSFPKQRQLLQHAIIESRTIRLRKKRILGLIDIQRDLYRAIRLLNYVRVNNKIFFDILESYPEYENISNFFKNLADIFDDSENKIKSMKQITLDLQDKLFKKYKNDDAMIANVYVIRFIFKQFRSKLSAYVALYVRVFK